MRITELTYDFTNVCHIFYGNYLALIMIVSLIFDLKKYFVDILETKNSIERFIMKYVKT